jgi:nucleoside-diphosphate-sugar epimerase
MANPKIVDASEVKRIPKKAPATRMIEALPEGYLTSRQVAEYFDVNIETIRRLARAKDEDGNAKFVAPSKAAVSGELVIWVYTPEDVKELADYFGQRLPRKKGEKKS